MTMNPPSEDIRDMLEDSSSGLGLVFGTDLFLNVKPNTPNDVVVINDSGGMRELPFGMERPNIQVIVRNSVYLTGYALMRSIKDYLHQSRNGEIWNTTKYISILTRSEIGFVGVDPKNRFEWSLNFQAYRTS